MINTTLEKMNEVELRELAKCQADAISAYQRMTFSKDEVIEALEMLYRRRVEMENARIGYEVAFAHLAEVNNKMCIKYEEPIYNCVAEGQ